MYYSSADLVSLYAIVGVASFACGDTNRAGETSWSQGSAAQDSESSQPNGDSSDDGNSSDDGDSSDDGIDPPEEVATIAELLTPFDVNASDLSGPGSWETRYGKSPEIVVSSVGAGLTIYAQDYSPESLPNAVLLRLEPLDQDYVVTQHLEPPFIDRVMGMAEDDAGNILVAFGIDEDDDITVDYPAPDAYRSDIARVVKLDWSGDVHFDTDLDVERNAFDSGTEQIINPMVAASSRLAWGNGAVALVHGINTDPDDSGVRHQKALTTHLDANSGAITRTKSIWVSHSFDQRVFHDGSGFMEMHLGDAYPRWVVLARIDPDSNKYPLFHIKGEHGANETRTRLGNVVRLRGASDYGYLAVFATERTTETEDSGSLDGVSGSRELALVRVSTAFESTDGETGQHLDPELPDVQTVDSAGEQRENKLRWITSYESEAPSRRHCERPQIVAINDDEALVLWERWDAEGSAAEFEGTYAVLVDELGKVVLGPERISDSHLPRGDDAIEHDGGALWVTGDEKQRSLSLHSVDAELEYTVIVVE